MQERSVELCGCDVEILDRIALEDHSKKVNFEWKSERSGGTKVAIYKFKGISFQVKGRIGTTLWEESMAGIFSEHYVNSTATAEWAGQE